MPEGCSHRLLQMRLVRNGALRILEEAEPQFSEALLRPECSRLRPAAK